MIETEITEILINFSTSHGKFFFFIFSSTLPALSSSLDEKNIQFLATPISVNECDYFNFKTLLTPVIFILHYDAILTVIVLCRVFQK